MQERKCRSIELTAYFFSHLCVRKKKKQGKSIKNNYTHTYMYSAHLMKEKEREILSVERVRSRNMRVTVTVAINYCK